MPTDSVLASDIAGWRELLVASVAPGEIGGVVDLLAQLEGLKSAACAIQADLAVAMDFMIRARAASVGVQPRWQGRGAASQIGLARQESPQRGATLLDLARDLDVNLPCTRRALLEGRLNEHRAMIIARELDCLSAQDQQLVDADLSHEGLGNNELAGEVRRRAQGADPAAATRRSRRAAADRHVTIRHTADTMTHVSGYVPLTQGVAVLASLGKAADTLCAGGDPRTRPQVMADLFVERLTGQSTALGVAVCIDLVISDETLFGAGHESADVPGYRGVPAQVAREVIARALDDQVPTWLRRVYTDPAGHLVATTSKQRFAPDGLADHVRIRDAGLCRTPWCDAPIRHTDHVRSDADGGPTTAPNLQGLCEMCNHAKQATGWTQRPRPGPRHTVETITPSGHTYRSRAPTPPRPAPTRYRLDIIMSAA